MTEIEIATFMRQVTPIGLSVLFVLWAMPRPLFETEVSRLIGRERHTVANLMPNLELFGFVTHIGEKPRQRWTLTDRARQLMLPAMVEKLPLPPSSSSDPFFQSINQIRSESEEEEATVENLPEKAYLLKKYNITGPKAAAVLADAWIDPLRLVAWMLQVHQMQRDKFPFTKSPESYALACLLRHDEPSQSAMHQAPALLDTELRWMPRDDDEEEEDQ